MRVEDVVEIAVYELDAKRLEWLAFDENLKFLPQHDSPRRSRALPQFEHVNSLDLVEPNPAEMLFGRPHNELTRRDDALVLPGYVNDPAAYEGQAERLKRPPS
jgi:hypothetical protein